MKSQIVVAALAAACAVSSVCAERLVTPASLETLKHSLIHRGDGKGRPDNTMEALLYTWAKGYTPESDIRFTKDGKIVAFHDNTLKKKKISEWLWTDLREQDVGSYRARSTPRAARRCGRRSSPPWRRTRPARSTSTGRTSLPRRWRRW